MDNLRDILREWVATHARGGIKQHSSEWLAAKVYTIGGSSMASIQGKNPYKTCLSLISEKIGLSPFKGSIKMQWGNLFEELIKKHVEHDKQCEVLGEDLYVVGPEYTAYSPDGLTVMDVDGREQVVLCEFKCPYSRIPATRPPAYYVPQVKMGMDLLGLPTLGLLIEGVYRRCSWDQLDNTPRCDTTLVSTTVDRNPISLGIIGFYYDPSRVAALPAEDSAQLKSAYDILCQDAPGFYVDGAREQFGPCADLGIVEPALFTQIMDLFDKKVLVPYYCTPLVDPTLSRAGVSLIQSMFGDQLDTFMDHCIQSGYINVGVLPWKLLQIKYHRIEKENDYVAPWLPKIKEIIELVKQCNAPENVGKKTNIFSSYVSRDLNAGFSDDW
jgi:hypothetical protein